MSANNYQDEFYSLSADELINIQNNYIDESELSVSYRSVSVFKSEGINFDDQLNIQTLNLQSSYGVKNDLSAGLHNYGLSSAMDDSLSLEKALLMSPNQKIFKDFSMNSYDDSDIYKIPDITKDCEWELSIAPTLSTYHFVYPVDEKLVNEQIIQSIDNFLVKENEREKGISLSHSYHHESSAFHCMIINELTNEVVKFVINIYKKTINQSNNLLVEWRKIRGSCKAFVNTFHSMKKYFMTQESVEQFNSKEDKQDVYLSIYQSNIIKNNKANDIIDVSKLTTKELDKYIDELIDHINNCISEIGVSTYSLCEYLTNIIFLLNHRRNCVSDMKSPSLTTEFIEYTKDNKSLLDLSLTIEHKALKRMKQCNKDNNVLLNDENEEFGWLVVMRLARALNK